MPKLLQGTLKKPSKDEIPECVSLRKNVFTLNEILFFNIQNLHKNTYLFLFLAKTCSLL